MRNMPEVVTKSARETKKIGKLFARFLLQEVRGRFLRSAFVVSLEGDLGSGKTTFAQGFAEGLGVRENVKSPTFVILKVYNIAPRLRAGFHDFIHIDAYRVDAKDLVLLGWKEFIKNPKNILLVEWGGRAKTILPKNTFHIQFLHKKSERERAITIF